MHGLRPPPCFSTKKNPAAAGEVKGSIYPCYSASVTYSSITCCSAINRKYILLQGAWCWVSGRLRNHRADAVVAQLPSHCRKRQQSRHIPQGFSPTLPFRGFYWLCRTHSFVELWGSDHGNIQIIAIFHPRKSIDHVCLTRERRE